MLYLEAFASAFKFRPMPPLLDLKLIMNVELLQSEVRKTNAAISKWREEFRECMDRSADQLKCNEEFQNSASSHALYLNNKFISKVFDFEQFYPPKSRARD